VTDANGVPRSLPLSAIDVEEGFNPRTTTDEKRQAQLVESVRRHGILQPLLVAPAGEGEGSLRTLHPALSRPGRCLAQVSFERFDRSGIKRGPSGMARGRRITRRRRSRTSTRSPADLLRHRSLGASDSAVTRGARRLYVATNRLGLARRSEACARPSLSTPAYSRGLDVCLPLVVDGASALYHRSRYLRKTRMYGEVQGRSGTRATRKRGR
jgi:hypothetical protein